MQNLKPHPRSRIRNSEEVGPGSLHFNKLDIQVVFSGVFFGGGCLNKVCVIEAGLELPVILLPPPGCRDDRCASPCPATQGNSDAP